MLITDALLRTFCDFRGRIALVEMCYLLFSGSSGYANRPGTSAPDLDLMWHDVEIACLLLFAEFFTAALGAVNVDLKEYDTTTKWHTEVSLMLCRTMTARLYGQAGSLWIVDHASHM